MVRVTYIFGTGVTEAERGYTSWDSSFLTDAITEKIVEKISRDDPILKNIVNELIVNTDDEPSGEECEPGIDVEYYVKLLEDIGQDDYTKAAEDLKKYFEIHSSRSVNKHGRSIDIEHYITLFETIDDAEYKKAARTLKSYFQDYFKQNLFSGENRLHPHLTQALLDYHKIPGVNETLNGVISLNYEDLTDLAFRNVYGGVNYNIKILSQNLDQAIPPLLKLHGSFNWKKTSPISVVDRITELSESDTYWIPPGVLKNKEVYPYNMIWGRAREIMIDCEVLRIVGCSLNRNDWGLLELLFQTQRLANGKRGFNIELIDFNDVGQNIKQSYPFLRNLETLYDLADLRKLHELNKDVDISNYWSDTQNIFEAWLKMKGELLEARQIEITSHNPHFSKFMGYS
ncbi:MAG: SIR2 family protein [Candidatus Altiarchaeia archaeon]